MSNWKEVVEEGNIIYVNEEVGNVMKTAEGGYICMIPRVFMLGPFDTLEQAQSVAEDSDGLTRVIDNYNLNLTELSKAIKK